MSLSEHDILSIRNTILRLATLPLDLKAESDVSRPVHLYSSSFIKTPEENDVGTVLCTILKIKGLLFSLFLYRESNTKLIVAIILQFR